MTRGKKLLALLLVLAVLAVGTALLSNMQLNEDAQIDDTSVTILSVDTEAVTTLSWTYGGDSPSFVRSDDSWENAEDSAFPVDGTKLDLMLVSLTDVTASATIADVSDLSQYGLEEPECTISVTGGTDATLCIGSETTMGGERYVSLGDGNVYMVDEGILDDFSYSLSDLLLLEEMPDLSTATSLSIQTASQTISMVYLEENDLTYSDSYVWFEDRDGSYTTLDTELVEALLSSIAGIGLDTCVDYNAEGSLALYGLEEPAATIVIDYTESVDVELEETDNNGDPIVISEETPAACTLEIGSTEAGSFIRLAGSNMVYSLDSDLCQTLLYTTTSELLPDDVLLMDWETVTSLDITLDGKVTTITREVVSTEAEDGTVTDETVYTMDGAETDGESVLDALDSLTSTGYAYGTSPERNLEIAVTIHRNTDSFQTVELALYQHDSTACLATLDGSATVYVSRSAVVDLIEAVNALILA